MARGEMSCGARGFPRPGARGARGGVPHRAAAPPVLGDGIAPVPNRRRDDGAAGMDGGAVVATKGGGAKRLKRAARLAGVLAPALYFLPVPTLVLLACGAADVGRHRRRTAELFEKYFAGTASSPGCCRR